MNHVQIRDFREIYGANISVQLYGFLQTLPFIIITQAFMMFSYQITFPSEASLTSRAHTISYISKIPFMCRLNCTVPQILAVVAFQC